MSGEHQNVRFGLRSDSRQKFEEGVGLIERLSSGYGDAVGRWDPRGDRTHDFLDRRVSAVLRPCVHRNAAWTTDGAALK
ncbi:hypothetical protein M3606_26150, partial [Cytobacillus horneckiae]